MLIDSHTITAKDYIFQALLELLHEKAFDEITVKQIVTKPGISRSTFYLHFQDKFDLMDALREEILPELMAYYEKDENVELRQVQQTTLNICKHVYRYRSFYQHEFSYTETTQHLSERLALRLEEVFADEGYAIFASYGTIGYLSHWVKNKFSITPEEAAKQLCKIGVTDWST